MTTQLNTDSKLVTIQHHTAYYFDRSTVIMPHVIRLRPAPHCRMPIHSYSLKVEPSQHFINWQQDPFSNYLARLVFTENANKLIFDVEIKADFSAINPFDFFIEGQAETFPFRYDTQLEQDLAPYLNIKEQGPKLQHWLTTLDLSDKSTIAFLAMMTQQVHSLLDYQVRFEAGVQECDETLGKQSGSCRDHAWLLVQALRHLGLAARFVSGYQVHLPTDTDSLNPSADTQTNDLHAWCEVYIPGAGWIGLDPSSGLFAAAGYIPLACTPDPVSAAPVTGNTSPCEVKFEYSTKVTLLNQA